MPRLALGLIETVGLAAAVEAADAAVKAANIALIGYELSKGGGLVTVKLEGDVGAIKAAVEAGCTAAVRVNKVWSKQVIPRPHEELDRMIYSRETVGKVLSAELQEKLEMNDPAEVMIKADDGEDLQAAVPEDDHPVLEGVWDCLDQELEKSDELGSGDREYCNLCLDPFCPRKKGELRSTCIHYAELKEVL